MTKAGSVHSTRSPTAGQISDEKLNPHSGPPVGGPAPGPSRRGLIAGLAGGAFLAAGAAFAGDHPDREFLALGAAYKAALERSEAALARVEACEAAYEAARPDRPDVLRHRLRDHSEFEFPAHDARIISDNAHSSFYSDREVEALRSAPRTHKRTGQPWPEAQARADAVIAAFDAHEAACARAMEAAGLYPAAEAYNAAVAERLAIGRQIAEARATTLDGLRIRAMIVSEMYDGDFTGGGGLDQALIWSTIRDLAAI